MNTLSYFADQLESKLRHGDKLLHQYGGPFNQDIVKKYAHLLSTIAQENKVAQRRLFYVFVELAQNVGYYSDFRTEENEDNSVGIGNTILYENDESFGFMIGNYINENALKVLERKCEIINNLDRESLREFKIYQRNLIPGTNGGAHIGLIMVALTTRKKIELDTYTTNENKNFFSINVRISKQEK